MNIGLYQSAASLTALERWQDVVTQNITAGQVPGYKKRTIQFDAMPMGEMQTDPKKRVGHGEGVATLFPKVNFGVNFQNGETYPTGRQLDVALSGEGFFSVQLPGGAKAYTRAGSLHVQNDRTLTMGDNNPVLSDSGNPITLATQGGDIVITQDGVITQNGNPIGRLGVFKFANNNQLLPLAGGVFRAPEGVEPTAVQKPLVMQGQMEASNVNPLREMVALVQISRAYEANQRMIQTQDQTLSKALETLG